MRVLQINTSESSGGAARAMLGLHESLRAIGVDSRILCLERQTADANVAAVELTAFGRALRRIGDERWVTSNRTALSNTYFTLLEHGFDIAAHPEVAAADILHLHWVSGLLSASGIARLLACGKPVVWTFHDEWGYTGGCHYTSGCEQWRSACRACPQLENDPRGLVSRQFARKQAAYAAGRVVVVGPSAWIAARARESALLQGAADARIEVLPNGVDLAAFRPEARAAGRAVLGVGDDTAVLLFGAGFASERRKGLPELLRALDLVSRDAARLGIAGIPIRFAVVGDTRGVDLPAGTIALGHVSDRARLASIVAGSDLFLLPSLEDNLPNGVSEALACGTTVVAFEAGGVPEMLEGLPQRFLATLGDAASFAREIARALGVLPELRASRERLRAVAASRYEPRSVAERHRALYESELARPRTAAAVPAGASPLSSWRDLDAGALAVAARIATRLISRRLRARRG